MLIAVDIGNSSINIGYFSEKGLIVQKFDTKPLRKASEYSLILNDFLLQNHIEKKDFNGIISSVVISHTSVLRNALELLLDKQVIDILIVDHKMNTGLEFKIKKPEEIGADRIANAVGAWEMFKTRVAVVDFGTATTITVVDKDANYIGGSIMPGIGLMNDILGKRTSKLKSIALKPQESALGKDTTECISSGLFYGTAGAVERILEEIEKETGIGFRVVVTGGHCHTVEKFIRRPHDIKPDLTLQGLKILYEKNRPS